MALVSEASVADLVGRMAKSRISFREDLNDTRHCHDAGGFSSGDDFSDLSEEDEDEDETSPSRDPETAEIASMERRALKYRKSLTMLNQIAGMQLKGAGTHATAAEVAAANGAKQPTKEHLLAAKKSIDDLTAWVNAAALEGDDDPFGDDDD
ncbi:hypothetical protein EDD11_003682 [Mortierella claussenii]|nr:hypothetical protein EDD11_003682 [Mortierella claussenii]